MKKRYVPNYYCRDRRGQCERKFREDPREYDGVGNSMEEKTLITK